MYYTLKYKEGEKEEKKNYLPENLLSTPSVRNNKDHFLKEFPIVLSLERDTISNPLSGIFVAVVLH